MDGDTPRVAGGYVVQLLPELEEEQLATMTERIEKFQRIEDVLTSADTTPESMLAALLADMEFTTLASTPLSYRCRCSDVRLIATLATLPRSDIEEMVQDGKPLEITCDYCGREYNIATERLRGLLGAS